MRFLLDEDLSPRSAEYLRSLGHDAIHVREVGLKGSPDQAVIAFAQSEGRILLTRDRDFADIRRYPPGSHAGIARLKIPHPTARAINAVLGRLLNRLGPADFTHNLVVTDGHRYRIRRPAPR